MSAHIVVDVRKADDSGIGTYIRNTVPRLAALEPRWYFTLLGDRASLREAAWARFPNAEVVHCAAPQYSVREQFELPARSPAAADLFWSPHYNIPAFTTLPLVVTLHDMAHLRLPEHTSSALRQAYTRTMLRTVRRKARAVLCNSQFTLDEYQTLFGEAARATVVHFGVDQSWFDIPAEPSLIDGPYFVFVGNLKPHKNVRVILEAMGDAANAVEASVVLVGRNAGMRTGDDALAPLIRSMGDRVVLAGEVDEQRLRQYVKHAVALVLPSLYEGFGLPPLEAMAAGTPAIVSRSGSLPEVCGAAALYFDALDSRDLARAMRSVLSDSSTRDALVARGREHARRFSWHDTATRTRDVLRAAVEGRHGS